MIPLDVKIASIPMIVHLRRIADRYWAGAQYRFEHFIGEGSTIDDAVADLKRRVEAAAEA